MTARRAAPRSPLRTARIAATRPSSSWSAPRPRAAAGPTSASRARASSRRPCSACSRAASSIDASGVGAPAAGGQRPAVHHEPGGDLRRVGGQPGLGPQPQSLGDVQPAVAALAGERGDGVHRADVGLVGLVLGEVDLGRHQQQLGQLEVVATGRRQLDGAVDEVLGVVEQVGVGERQRVVGVEPRQLGRRCRSGGSRPRRRRRRRAPRAGCPRSSRRRRGWRARARPSEIWSCSKAIVTASRRCSRAASNVALLRLDRPEVDERLQLGHARRASSAASSCAPCATTSTAASSRPWRYSRIPRWSARRGRSAPSTSTSTDVEERQRPGEVAAVADLEGEADRHPRDERTDRRPSRASRVASSNDDRARVVSPRSRSASPAIHHSWAASPSAGSAAANRWRAASQRPLGIGVDERPEVIDRNRPR